MFGHVCVSKFSNLVRSWPIEMVQPVADTTLNRECDAMCYALFGIVCGSKFSNLARSWSIEMIEPAAGTTLNGECDAMCCAVFGGVCGSKFNNDIPARTTPATPSTPLQESPADPMDTDRSSTPVPDSLAFTSVEDEIDDDEAESSFKELLDWMR